jgi:pyruvyltransferase
MKLLIECHHKFHYEILESIISKHQEIVGTISNDITVNAIDVDEDLIRYIEDMYPHVKFVPYDPVMSHDCFDMYINTTVYPEDKKLIETCDPNKNFFISHRVNHVFDGMDNVFYLTPLCGDSKKTIVADVLPFRNQTRMLEDIPRFIVQGDMRRRDIKALETILDLDTDYPFMVKIVGHHLSEKLQKHPRIEYHERLNFMDFHKHFTDCYCIMTLVTENDKYTYYSTMLTSSINYSKCYAEHTLIDENLQRIYNLDNATTYTESSILDSFRTLLKSFYNSNSRWLAHKSFFIVPKSGIALVARQTTLTKRSCAPSNSIREMVLEIGDSVLIVSDNTYSDYYVVEFHRKTVAKKSFIKSGGFVYSLYNADGFKEGAIYPIVEETDHTYTISNVKNTNRETVNLHFHSDNQGYGNFGDELSKIITFYLTDHSKYKIVYNFQGDVNHDLICIGSYIHMAKNSYVIFGAGVRTDPPVEGKHLHAYETLDVICVRGPTTQKFLAQKGINSCSTFLDPAQLLPLVYQPIKLAYLSSIIGILPHKSQYLMYVDTYINDEKYIVINPTDHWTTVVDQISSCKCIISSSLHGLIVADAYKIPNVWLQQYPLVEGVLKFHDYFNTANITYTKVQCVSKVSSIIADDNLFMQSNHMGLTNDHMIRLSKLFPFR